MSIAADIEKITKTEQGLVLELTGRLTRQANGAVVSSPPGQSHLTILDPTWEPEVGMSLWGGSDSVIIESQPRHEYERLGYTTLREKWHDHR